MRNRKRSAAVALALAVGLGTAGCSSDPEVRCEGSDSISVICGFMSPEDLEVIPDTGDIVAGGFSLDNENGDVRVLRLSDGEIQKVYPPDTATSGAREGWGDPACPGPPTEGFASHGIHLSGDAPGPYTLLVVNHTGREAIEWFELERAGDDYRAAWRGCVIVDEPYWVNDVAMIPGGGLVASHMMPREIAATLFDRPPNDRVETGFVVEWQAATGWRKVEGSEGALPNGVQVSADGSVLYSNQYLSNQVVAIERATGKRLWTTAVEGAPDNMSIMKDGRLLLSAHLMSLRSIRDDCMLKPGPFCGLPFAVFALDPATGEAEKLFQHEGPPFGGSTVAVQSGDSIYLGSFHGERIGRIPVPQ